METLIGIMFPACATLAFILIICAMGYAPNGNLGGIKHFIFALACAVVAGLWSQYPHFLGNVWLGVIGLGILVFAWAKLARKHEWAGVFVGLPALYLVIAGLHSVVK